MFWTKLNAFWNNSAAGALGVKDVPVLLGSKPGGRIRENIDMRGNPFGDPHKLVLDLAGSHKSRHLQSDLVAGPAVGEQVK